MGKRDKNKRKQAGGQPAEGPPEYGEIDKAFQERIWTALTRFDLMENRCTSPIKAIVEMVRKSPNGTVFDTPQGPLCYLNRGGDVLAVAHIDAVGHLTHFFHGQVEDEHWVFSPWLDDRLGAFVILDVLPELGFNYDILLCTNEERGASTAYYFQPPEGKQYRYIFEWDRNGETNVKYQYDHPEFEKALTGAGFSKPDHGSYTCIVELEHLGAAAINFGVGYTDYHTKWCKANLSIVFRQLVRFCHFWYATEDRTYPFDPSKGHSHYRKRGQRLPGATPAATDPEATYNYWDRPDRGAASEPGTFGEFLGHRATGMNPRNLPAGIPIPFPFVTGDQLRCVDQERDKHIYIYSGVGAYIPGRRCWEVSVRRQNTGSVTYTSFVESDLELILNTYDAKVIYLSVQKWITDGRLIGWRFQERERQERRLANQLPDRPAVVTPEFMLTLLADCHGQPWKKEVQQARKTYESLYCENEGLDLLSFSTEFLSLNRQRAYQVDPVFRFNEPVELENGDFGYIDCMYPTRTEDGEQFFWVDCDEPDKLGMTLEFVSGGLLFIRPHTPMRPPSTERRPIGVRSGARKPTVIVVPETPPTDPLLLPAPLVQLPEPAPTAEDDNPAAAAWKAAMQAAEDHQPDTGQLFPEDIHHDNTGTDHDRPSTTSHPTLH